MKKTDLNWKQELQELFISGLQQSGIDSDKSYLVGVSGGMDSAFLAQFLHKAKIKFAIAHLNHHARENATRDQAFVKKLAVQYQTKFFTQTIDVPAFSEKQDLSFEEAARISRYKFLMETAIQHGFDGIIVGHQADDQVETVLMHLLRGCGIAGLRGMRFCEIIPQFSTTVPIIRPMLSIWRDDIQRYCHDTKLAYVEDETNKDESFFRNRLRLHLLPLLEDYNAGVKQHLWQTSMISQQTLCTLDSLKLKTWQSILIEKQDRFIVWDKEGFLSLGSGLQQALIRYALEQLLPDMRDFGYTLTLDTVEYLKNPPEGGQWQVIGDIFIQVHEKKIYLGDIDAMMSLIQQRFPQWDQPEKEIVIDSEAVFSLNSGWKISLMRIQRKDIEGCPWLYADDAEAWLDADQFKYPIVFRSFQDGDRFEPLGMEGQTMKVADYFINRKIPKPVRKNYPLICDQGGILWIVGERIADRCKVSSTTKTILHLQLLTESVDRSV